jgi:hypothetical protein
MRIAPCLYTGRAFACPVSADADDRPVPRLRILILPWLISFPLCGAAALPSQPAVSPSG